MATGQTTVEVTGATSNGTTTTWSPGTGELWYCADLTLACDGSGDNSDNPEASVRRYDPNVGDPGSDAQPRTFIRAGDQGHKDAVYHASAGFYVTESDEIAVEVLVTSAATLDAVARLRRVY